MLSIINWKIKRITKKVKSMMLSRETTQPSEQQIKREILYYNELIALYKKCVGKKKAPYAEIMIVECYKNAASLDDDLAHYQLGLLFMNEAKFRQKIQEEGLFNSNNNLNQMQQLFAEAQAHLQAADQLGHVEAKRLRGLSLIQGWGVDTDPKAGFELVVASIEQEGSWDRVPQIFAAMGLNKPEFFSAIMHKRNGAS